jgi:2-methylcitrate dehydratase PrpD
VNGAAGDALDFSDCNRIMNGHATATVLPCVLALADQTEACGEAALRAFVAGVEAACRVGALLGRGALETPFHPTAIAGTLGAAAGGAILLALDDAAFAAALGLAATQAAGLADAVGTMAKPLHAGTAAAAGTLAARLASRGFTAPGGALDKAGGFVRAHTAAADPEAPAAHRGRFLILQNLMKEHAACALAAGSIENMLAIKRATAFAPAAVRSIRLQIAASSAYVCDIEHPRTGLEMKFSVRTLASMALLGYDTGRLETFGDATARAADIAALRERVTIVAREDLDVAVSLATVELTDGRILEAGYDERTVDGDVISRRSRTRAKFGELTKAHLSPAEAAALEDRVFALETSERFDVRP